MPSKAFSITVSAELAQALEELRVRRVEERSRLIETLLRENPYVQEAVRAQRLGPRFRKGRDAQDLTRLLRIARARWERRVKSGQVRIRYGRK